MQLLLFSCLTLHSLLPPEAVLKQLHNASGVVDKKIPAVDPLQQPDTKYRFAFEVATPALSKTPGTQVRGHIVATSTGSRLWLFMRVAWQSYMVLGITLIVCGSMLWSAVPLLLKPDSSTLDVGNVVLPLLMALGLYSLFLLGFWLETRRVSRLLDQLLCTSPAKS